MPYITEKERKKYQEKLERLPPIRSKGELEYCIFYLMMKYRAEHEERYLDLHDCTYAAQHCADEFRRRFLDIREDSARMKNGDINVV